MTAPRCDRCAFYDEVWEGSSRGLCRRHSPQATSDDGDGVWPQVNCDDWCGEYHFRAGVWPKSATETST